MSFYRDTIRVARKEHKCDICKGVIKKGEKYHEKAGLNYKGEFFHRKECESCQPVIAEFCQTHYAANGYSGERIQEWWRDVKCYDCQHYFPFCDPDEQCKKLYGEQGLTCLNRTKYSTCAYKEEDICERMTHYCRCEHFLGEENVAEMLQKGCRF